MQAYFYSHPYMATTTHRPSTTSKPRHQNFFSLFLSNPRDTSSPLFIAPHTSYIVLLDTPLPFHSGCKRMHDTIPSVRTTVHSTHYHDCYTPLLTTTDAPSYTFTLLLPRHLLHRSILSPYRQPTSPLTLTSPDATLTLLVATATFQSYLHMTSSLRDSSIATSPDIGHLHQRSPSPAPIPEDTLHV